MFSKHFTVTFLFAVFLTFTLLPQNAEAQDRDPYRTEHLPSWSKIDFSDNPKLEIRTKNKSCMVVENTAIPGLERYRIYYNAEFETGSSEITSSMKTAAKRCREITRSYYQRAHAVVHFGTDNAETNNQASNRPLSERSAPEKQWANDYRLGQLRGNNGRNLTTWVLAGLDSTETTIKQARNYVPGMVEVSTVSAPDSLQKLDNLTDRSALEFRKSHFIVADIYQESSRSTKESKKRITRIKDDMERWMSSIEGRIDSLASEHQQTRKLAKQNASRIDSLDTAVANIDTGTEFSIFLGAGGQYFANEPTGFGEVGLRVGDIELSYSYNINPNTGTINLSDLGQTQVGRSGYRAALAWYPIQTGRLELGPEVAFEHGENYLVDREEFLTVYESTQLGVAANVQLVKGLHLHGSLGYAVTNSAQSSDLKLERNNSRIRGGISLRWKF